MSFIPGAAATYLVSGFLKMDVRRQLWVETDYPPTLSTPDEQVRTWRFTGLIAGPARAAIDPPL